MPRVMTGSTGVPEQRPAPSGAMSWACAYVWGYSAEADHDRCTGRVHDKTGQGPRLEASGPGGNMRALDGPTVRCCCPCHKKPKRRSE